MSLYDRKFVGGLRKRVRTEVRSNRKWREEARRYRPKFWTRGRDVTGLRWLLLPVFAAAAAGIQSSGALWLILGAWGVYLSLARAGQFQRFCGTRFPALIGLPVSAPQAFEIATWRSFKLSLWLAFDALAFTGSYFWFSSNPATAWWGIVPAAITVWAAATATTIILISWRPGAPYEYISSGVMILGVIGVAVFSEMSDQSSVAGQFLHQAVVRATPPGWAVQTASWLTGTRNDFPVLAAGLLTFWIAFAVRSYKAFQRTFWIWEPDTPPPPANTSEADEAEDEGRATGEETITPSRASEIEDLVLLGTFLKPASLATSSLGWIERFILLRFRQHAALLDFLLCGNPNWSQLYGRGWLALGVGFVLAWVARDTYSGLMMPVLGLAMFIAISCTCPIFGGHWPGLRLGFLGGRRLAILAILPTGLRESSRAILRVNAFRFILALPCWVASFVALGYFREWTPIESVTCGAELWLIMLSLQPFFFVFRVSPGTNDTSSGCITTLVFLIACFAPIAAAIVAIVTIFKPASPMSQSVALAALALTSMAFARFYQRLYNRRFDLLAKFN